MQTLFRSVIFKLTAAYVGIIMAICLVFSGVFYHLAVTELHTGIYNQYSRWYSTYGRFGLNQAGSSPASELSARADHILKQLIYLNIGILVVSAVLSYALARKSLQPIAAAHEQQKRFTADVSHELRTPLTALKMESEVSLLNPKAPAAELRQTLRSNLEEVEHMETLINNLLLLSSLEANKLRTDFSDIDLADAVQAAVHTVSGLAKTKDITLDTELGTETVRVHGDKASLTQLFVILLENAIKYSPAGSPVEVSLKQSKGSASVNVTDHGQGIAGDALPHVFDRFYRADSSRTGDVYAGKTQGYGLGLSLAKLIADLHDGEIVISSAIEVGTTSTVTLN